MADLLFVYGTLRSGSASPMARELARSAALIGPARMRGRLVDLGLYPGLVDADDPDDWVDGEVWGMRAPGELLPAIDAYEGCGANDPEPHEYKRVIRIATLATGERVAAWVYLYRGDVPAASVTSAARSQKG